MELSLDGMEVEVVVRGAGATAADLACAAGVPVARLGVPPDASIAELGLDRGSALPPPPAAVTLAAPTIATVGGLDAGRRVRLAGGRASVGRGQGCDVGVLAPSVSRRHAEVVVDGGGVAAVDLASRNGTWLVPPDATAPERPVGRRHELVPHGWSLRLGGIELAVVDTPDDTPVAAPAARPAAAGTTSFNRPPRPALPPPPLAVEVPAPPPEPAPPPSLGIVAVVAPIAMAGVLVVAMSNPMFALLALLSPIIAVGNRLEGGRRTRRATRRNAAQRAADLARFRAELAAAAAAETARRQVVAPDLAEVVRRADQPSTKLWERRLHHDDALVLRVGVGDVPWDPPLAGDRHPRPADLADAVAAAATLRRCPATVDLSGGGVVGVVGPRSAALAVARSLLCQAAVHHGPADLPIAVAVEPDAVDDWDWAKWLPHVVDTEGTGRWLAVGRDESDDVAACLLQGGAAAAPLVVVDGNGLLEGRRAPLRRALDREAAGIVVAASVDRLPAACTSVVVVDGDGIAELRLPALGQRIPNLLAAGMAEDTARRCARALARFDDPELDVAGAALPDLARLLPLLDLDDAADLVAGVAHRWRTGGADPRPAAPIGVAVDGILDVDLVADGPHGLVAGTTGAGKSELLRSLVAGLAAACSPEHLTFVLIDFKGGSAFDACGRLPHVVGLVTDLDEALAERALRCLEAELRYRERLLRLTGAEDLSVYRRCSTQERLPRLVVVVDEFATLKAELPEFVDALVGVAQRGRSLGVHLVLATQRPSGSISDNIRANTNLRIALRVQDTADSIDVVDTVDAAHLPRRRPGRACIRLGPGEVVTVQTALATSGASGDVAAVEVRPFRFGRATEPSPAGHAARGPTDLERLVDACRAAWSATGRPAPRRPWPDPLPTELDLGDLPPGAIALGDDPDGQRHVPVGWDLAAGNLAIYGVGGSGTTTTLLAVAVALAADRGPDELHVYAVDHGAGELTVLGGLPHTGAVLAASERERQVRLVRWLRRELDRRRGSPGGGAGRGSEAVPPRIVVLIDGMAGFLAQFDDVLGLEVADAFERVFADGPEVGIHMAVTADRPGALPAALSSVVRQRWVHRLADGLDAGAAGVKGSPPPLVPGRFVDVLSGLVAHAGRPAAGWEAAATACADRWAGAPATVVPIGALPDAVRRAPVGIELGGRPWVVPIGVADDDLGVATLPLWDGDHVLVAGPPRSGRTTALQTIAAAGVEAGLRVVALDGRRRSALHGGIEIVDAAALAALEGPALVLVDDAETVDDPAGVLEALVERGPTDVHVIAAARSEVVRGLYAHWTRAVRRSRLGLLLRPHLDLDGELLGVALPRRVGVPLVAGRGFLVVDGAPRLIQVALP